MTKQATVATPTLVPRTGVRRFLMNFKRDWQLHVLLLIPFLYILIFTYGPMYGIQISFKDYSPRKGILGSEWVGLANFKAFFDYYRWTNLLVNTVVLSLEYSFFCFPMPIILALLMHVYTGKTLKKVTENIAYIPNFISLVILVGMLNTVLNPVSGLLGYFYRVFGITSYTDIRADKDTFRPLYILSGMWQNTGWNSILYASALSGVSDDLHEAAKIDGASRMRRIFAVDLPAIMPLIAMKLILDVGGTLSVGYQKAYLLQNEMNKETSEIISTFVYKEGIRSGNMSFGSAIGLLESVINTTLLFLANWVCNLLTDNEMGLF